ncbi:hypothetical protein GOP47_0030434 [Adiantum capillus-veneris]|nr:hypothetical protein GOP47_0030434 [Adiantum capillus-veneris]
MYIGSLLLPILTSASSSDQQIAELLSVEDLLDNPWHYDCVGSPRSISSDIAPKSLVSLSKRPVPAPYKPPLSALVFSKPSANHPLTPPSLSESSANRPLSPLFLSKQAACNRSASSTSKPTNRILITQTSSNYVSLASFINNGHESSYRSSSLANLDLSSKRSSNTILSKCRERESKAHISGDTSNSGSYIARVAVD